MNTSILQFDPSLDDHRYSILRNRDWNPRINRVSMYVNLPVIKMAAVSGDLRCEGILILEAVCYCVLHSGNRIYGDVLYGRSDIRYCLPLSSCALWFSRVEGSVGVLASGIVHDDFAQASC